MDLKRFLPYITALIVIAAAAGAQTGGDWPQWRGPNRDAVSKETGLLTQWPAAGPPLVWRASGLGKGFSSISIAGGRIFTMGDLEGAQHVICLDRATGRRLWTAKVGPPHADGGSRGTPTVAGGLVYAIGTEGNLVCVEAATGRERWRKNLQSDFGGQMMSGWKYSESPLVDGDKLICTPGGNDALLVALNRQTGALIWKCAAQNLGSRGKDGAGYSSPVVAEAGGIRQYVQFTGRGLVGVSAQDGRLLWNYNRVANDVANITTPVVHGSEVFGSSAYNAGSGLVRLTASGGGMQAQEVYYLGPNVLQNHHGGLVLVGNYLYGGDGQNNGKPICIEWATGKVMWKEPRGVGGGSASVCYADGHLYFLYENNVAALVEATPAGFKLKGQFEPPKMPGTAWAHPVVLGGRLYLRHDDALFCYNVKRG
jgi:outer membrane protein assembly factor BamB